MGLLVQVQEPELVQGLEPVQAQGPELVLGQEPVQGLEPELVQQAQERQQHRHLLTCHLQCHVNAESAQDPLALMAHDSVLR